MTKALQSTSSMARSTSNATVSARLLFVHHQDVIESYRRSVAALNARRKRGLFDGEPRGLDFASVSSVCSVIPAITENNNTADDTVNGSDSAITARCQLTARCFDNADIYAREGGHDATSLQEPRTIELCGNVHRMQRLATTLNRRRFSISLDAICRKTTAGQDIRS